MITEDLSFRGRGSYCTILLKQKKVTLAKLILFGTEFQYLAFM